MGGRTVETGWEGPLGKVRNWIEVRFSVMVRSLGLHRIAAFPSGKHLAARSFWGPVARVNLIHKAALLTLVHNLIRSQVLLRMAGVGL
jgi:hypothetical protein